MMDTEETHRHQKFSPEDFSFVWEGRVLSWDEWLDLPWEEWIRRAREGDTEATKLFCLAAEPLIRFLCERRLLTDRLGKDEVRSMAALAMIEFLMTYNGNIRNRKAPFILWRYVRCDLLDNLRNQDSRNKFELPETHRRRSGAETNLTLADWKDPNPEIEPEQVLLKEEFNAQVHNAMRSLNRYEKTVIHSYYFERKSIGEISREMGCSPQYIRRLRRKALVRLRDRLKERLA